VNLSVKFNHVATTKEAKPCHRALRCIGRSASSFALLRIFTKPQRFQVICLTLFAASFSPLSSVIFFPTIYYLSQALHVTIGRINLTIPSYIVVARLALAILGDLADKIG
jgi:ABC-type uncharacterized transport system fused permease/ATPase subunit